MNMRILLRKTTFYGFHIHTATERYQQSGYREDTYAEETNRYADYHGAIECMLQRLWVHDLDEKP